MTAWQWQDVPLFGIAHVLVATPVTLHVLLRKHERAAVAWIGLLWLAPFGGALLYFLFGINRIQRKAVRLRRPGQTALPHVPAEFPVPTPHLSPAVRKLVSLGLCVHPQPFVSGNTVEPLVNGDQAYPAMLEAIASARRSVALSTYIFDPDRAGRRFMAAIDTARRNGAEVRVLVDGVGTANFPVAVDDLLESVGAHVARFLPHRLGRYLRFINLRNHRKILLVDGHTAFLGGMNIREGHLLAENPRRPIQDVHFRVRGPVIDQLHRVFEEDWEFASGERAELPRWSGAPPGAVQSRILADGPDVDFEKLQWILLGALSTAEQRVRVLTPYFLPNEIVTNAIQLAAMRGVRVEVLLPARSDLRFLDWAVQGGFERLVAYGVRILLGPPPFDHGKLFLVDEGWALIGSSNWDARSLRLNFEVDMELIDPALCARLAALFDDKAARARPVTLDEVRGWTLSRKLRNHAMRLFSPYL